MNATSKSVTEIKVGHGYFMGASSDPCFVIVLGIDAVNGTMVRDPKVLIVRYIDTSKVGSPAAKCEMSMFMLAVDAARDTLTRRVTDASERFSSLARGNLKKHGAPAKLAHYDRVRVHVRPMLDGIALLPGTITSQQENDHWTAAGKYGCIGYTDETAMFDIETSRSTIDKIESDPMFQVERIDIIRRMVRA